jgi:hypothetical protein
MATLTDDIVAELDRLDIEFDADGDAIHLYPTHARGDDGVARAEAGVWWMCCHARPVRGVLWHPRRPS